jgi:hypothetical protein
VRGRVGAHNVGQHDGVAVVGLLPRDGVPVAVPRRGQRVDRVDPPAGAAQARHEQAPIGLDGHRNRRPGIVAVLGKQRQQLREPGGVVGDAAPPHHRPFGVNHRDVVMVVGPVNPAEHQPGASLVGEHVG